MVVRIFYYKNKDEPEYSFEKYVALWKDAPYMVNGHNKDETLNHIKGIALCTMGQWKKVPNKIEFIIQKIDDEEEKKRWEKERCRR